MRQIFYGLILSLISLPIATIQASSNPCKSAQSTCQQLEADAAYGTSLGNSTRSGLHMYRLNLAWYPTRLNYYDLSLGFEGSYSAIMDSKAVVTADNKLVAFSLNPVARFYMRRDKRLDPFLEASVGVAHLSQKQLGIRRLGSHAAFALFAGFGLRYQRPHYALISGVRFTHWSNAELSKDNAGINVPVTIYLGFRI